MKKLIAILLAVLMLLSLAACGSSDKGEVAVLWSGDGVVKVPDSLNNALERAMYIEGVSYKHFGANGDQAAQIKQAEAALLNGATALVVELVDSASAQTITDLAREKNVPVVFFNCDVVTAVISGYEKCALVNADNGSVGAVLGALIGKTAVENYEAYDRNGDGVISYAVVGDDSCEAVVTGANAVLLAEGKIAMEPVSVVSADEAVSSFTDENAPVELFITGADEDALLLLAALQGKGYNSTRLKTHNIPVFTVGADADAKVFTNTETMSDEEKDALIFNVTNIIGNGQMTGTAINDFDTMAAAIAAITSNLVKGEAVLQGVEENITDGAKTVSVPYTTYA